MSIVIAQDEDNGNTIITDPDGNYVSLPQGSLDATINSLKQRATRNSMEFLEEVKVLRLRPDDTIVFSFNENLNDIQYGMVEKGTNDLFPDHRVIITENGNDLSVLRGEES